MGPTTDATPGPQAGAMLGSYLQPPASALEGDVPPPRSLTKRPRAEPSVRRGSVCRDKGGTVRGETGNPGAFMEEAAGGGESQRGGGEGMGPGEGVVGQRGGGAMMGRKEVLSPC